LSRTLRLTGAETRLLGELVAGASLAEIAERHAVSINTLRVQLHRLFQKTGTHRQSELLRFALMNGGPDSERR
jgi:DNA-binding CsgD family transcriptional regulator